MARPPTAVIGNCMPTRIPVCRPVTSCARNPCPRSVTVRTVPVRVARRATQTSFRPEWRATLVIASVAATARAAPTAYRGGWPSCSRWRVRPSASARAVTAATTSSPTGGMAAARALSPRAVSPVLASCCPAVSADQRAARPASRRAPTTLSWMTAAHRSKVASRSASSATVWRTTSSRAAACSTEAASRRCTQMSAAPASPTRVRLRATRSACSGPTRGVSSTAIATPAAIDMTTPGGTGSTKDGQRGAAGAQDGCHCDDAVHPPLQVQRPGAVQRGGSASHGHRCAGRPRWGSCRRGLWRGRWRSCRPGHARNLSDGVTLDLDIG